MPIPHSARPAVLVQGEAAIAQPPPIAQPLDWHAIPFGIVALAIVVAVFVAYRCGVRFRSDQTPGAILAVGAACFAVIIEPTALGVGLAVGFIALGAAQSIIAERKEAAFRMDQGDQANKINRLITDNERIHADNALIKSALASQLHIVRDRAQRLSNDLKSYGYASKQSGQEVNAVDRMAFRDRVCEAVETFEMHGIRDQQVAILLASNYLDLDAFAHGLDRMIQVADTRSDAKQEDHMDILAKLNKDRERDFAERARVLIQTLLTFGGKYLAEMQQDKADLRLVSVRMAFDFLQNQRYEVKAVVEGFAERGQVFNYGVDLDSPSNLKDLMAVVQWLQAALHRLPR